MQIIQQCLTKVYSDIEKYAKKHARDPKSIKLLAVSKKQSIDKMKEAISVGQREFGESYVQEALPKIAALSNVPDIVWHYIGPIQSNKTKEIAKHFSWVQSVSREKIAVLLNQYRPKNLPPLNICIEINISGEQSKSGVSETELLPLITKIKNLPNLRLRGIMAIPAPSNDYHEQVKSFESAVKIFSDLNKTGLNLDTLSLGMSNDLEAAIAVGSTLVRVGTSIFGERS